MALSPPKTPRLPKSDLHVPKLKLVKPRPARSIELDEHMPGSHREPDYIPPYIPWKDFFQNLTWKQGQHITLVGTTNSGKTTLALRLLPLREFTIVLATKRSDASLYPRLEREGFVIDDDTSPDPHETPKVIFKPRLSAPTDEARQEQRNAFGSLLVNIFNEGGWCVYGDEIRYLSQNLKLQTELETLWLQGRSLHVSMVVSTQRPVSIPIVAFEAATHLFLFRMTDKKNIDRAGEFAGADAELIRWLLPRLPEHEVLYIDTRTGRMVRTKVRL